MNFISPVPSGVGVGGGEDFLPEIITSKGCTMLNTTLRLS